MIKKQDLPYCPVATTLQIIGSKWKLLILQELQIGCQRFSELKKRLPGISKHVLSATLKSMVEDGIVAKIIFSTTPLRIEYQLSEVGISLLPVLEAMKKWGYEYQRYRKSGPGSTA